MGLQGTKIAFIEGAPWIDVLLATFNGERFLPELLDSLIAQTNVNISLIVSDDGSTDQTLEIIKQYSNNFQEFKLVSGPKNGPSKNFFALLKLSTKEYVALADQDDIWDPTHLANSIKRIKEDPTIPVLSYTSVRELNNNTGKVTKIWPEKNYIKDLNSIIIRNVARGCTIVLNRKAVELINTKSPENEVMHDWWILLVIATHGAIQFGPEPEITYRLHENNHIGIPKKSGRLKSYAKTLKHVKTGRWAPYGQALELSRLYGTSMQKKDQAELTQFLDLLKPTLKNTKFIFSKKTFRNTIRDELSLRVIFILAPLMTRNWK
jgi:glycosyltransferase involved in cell wall biosynthesis